MAILVPSAIMQRSSIRNTAWPLDVQWRPSAFVLSAILTVATFLPNAYAQQENYTEYEVKAAFLYQFIAFVEWPSDAFADDAAPFTIGILGDDPFQDILDNMVKDKKAHNRDIVIKRSQKPEDLKSCHMVFVSLSKKDNISEVMDVLSDSSILTLGEWDLFTKQGGIIRFLMHKNKIGFEINNKTARKANLKISSQLLNLSQVAGDNDERSN